MPVTFTKPLTREMQLVADCRESVRRAEADVEEKKSALKSAKAHWEICVEELNKAIDEAIDAERQPTLFDGLGKDGGDDLNNPPVEPPPGPAPAAPEGGGEGGEGGDAGEVIDAEYTVNPPEVASLPPAAEREPAAKWRALDLAEHLDALPEVFDAFEQYGIATYGELADCLVAGDTFGLKLTQVEDLKEEIEQASADSDGPVTFPDDEDEEAAAVAFTPPSDPKLPLRGDFPDDKTGKWEHQIATARHFGNRVAHDDQIAEQARDYRLRQADGDAAPAWGIWSEFDVKVKDAAGGSATVHVLYMPDWRGDRTKDFLEAWGESLAEHGYYSDVVENPKGRRPKVPLAEWVREWAQSRADEFAKERKRDRRRKADAGGDAEAEAVPAAATATPEKPRGKANRPARRSA